VTVGVRSEIGRLRRVLVHEPGPEVDRMVPAMMEELLFDDIVDGDRAREEHGRFRRVLQLAGVEVLDAGELLDEVLADCAEARDFVLRVAFADLDEDERGGLAELPAAALAEVLVAGSRTRPHPSGVEVEDLFDIPPIPNWCFQRDPQIVLGSGVAFASMAAPARHREALLSRLLFRFHPALRDVPVIFDPLEVDRDHALFTGRERPHLEGGDLLVLTRDVLAVGLSERTDRQAVRDLARALARREDGPRTIVAVAIPRRRAYMHLDTLLTPIDHDACLVYEPVIGGRGPERAQVFSLDLGRHDPPLEPCEAGVLDVLARHGVALEAVPCGGSDPIAQQREQWTDGANALALAPGVLALYDRNRRTADELDRRGFRLVAADDLLLGREEVDVDAGRRVCILLPSHEIARARGGPHCLTHPLERDGLD
jgi:arginine deiminase